MVPPEVTTLADIGFDHGDLMLALLGARPDLSCIGVELKPHIKRDFEARHASKIKALGKRLDLRVGSGVVPLQAGESQLAVVAGMGEKTILKIMAEGVGKLAPPALWILAPMALEAALRPTLSRWGLRVLDERLTLEATHFNEILLVGPGTSSVTDPVEQRFGSLHFERREPLLLPFLEDLARRHHRALQWQAKSGGPSPDDERGTKLALLEEARSRAERFVTS